MGMLFLLRIMSELAFYIYFASFVGGLLGMSSAPVVAYLIIALCCGLSWLLRERKHAVVRMSPFLLLGLCAFVVDRWSDAAILLPAAVYAFYTCFKQLYGMTDDFQKRFMTSIKIMPFLLIFTIFPIKNTAGVGAVVTNYVSEFAIPFGLIYLFVSVFLMRMLHHDEATLKQPRFRLLNIGVLGGVSAVALIVSNEATYKAIGVAAGAVKQYVVEPLAALVARLFLMLMEAITAFMNRLGEVGPEAAVIYAPAPEPSGEPVQIMPEQVPKLEDILPDVLGYILLAVAIVAIILLFWRMLGKRSSGKASAGVTETRSSLAPVRPQKRRGILSRVRQEPREQIRSVYRKFLLLCRVYGISATPSDTSLTMHSRASSEHWCPEDEAGELRELYVSARYSEQEPTREDVRAIRKRYAAILAHSKKRVK